jgi:hypothetical protein
MVRKKLESLEDIKDALAIVDRTASRVDQYKQKMAGQNRQTQEIQQTISDKVDLVTDPAKDSRREPEDASVPKVDRRSSGRFFMQFAKASGQAEFSKIKSAIAESGGRVVDSGVGTASDPDAAWFEVGVKLDEKEALEKNLKDKTDVIERLQKSILVVPGEGRTLAKQLDLFEPGDKSEESDQ